MLKYHFNRKYFGKTVLFISLLLSWSFGISQIDPAAQYNGIADRTVRGFDPTRPYYVGLWKERIPDLTKAVRRLNEQVAIIEINSQTEFDSIKQHAILSAANDNWKFTSFAERML